MDGKPRCQSCGMPLAEGSYGTEADGASSKQYCKFCYQEGSYTNPDLTVDDMIDLSIENMRTDLHMPEDKAEQLAHEVIPHLGRWQN